jgi:hypothetical protein
MKKYINYIIIAVFLVGCNDFEELNVNPNEPTSVSSGVLFTSALRTAVKTSSNESFLLANNIAQLTAKTLRTEIDSYNWNAFPTLWEGMYESLTDLEGVIAISEEGGNNQAKGAAMIVKVWVYATLTNTYGDIPYTNAIKGSEANFTPSYDTQESIYSDLLASLDTAVSLLNSSGSIDGDIIYGGDQTMWKKFANSLQLRLLLQASNKMNVATKFNSIVSQGTIFKSNSEQASLSFLNAFPNQFPTRPLKIGDFDAVALSKTSLTVMEGLKDPRLSRYARPENDNYNTPSFLGVENGVGGQTGSRLGVAFYDYPGLITANDLNVQTAEGLMMTYAELEFILAEGALKGWISDSVAEHYKKGIEASHSYYSVNYSSYGWDDFEDFYVNSGVAYDEEMDLLEQKWLSVFFTGMEPYFELRRMYVNESGWDGLRFIAAPIGTNGNDYKLPMRFLYPGQEQSLNQANYSDASSRYSGGDTINGKMWIVN